MEFKLIKNREGYLVGDVERECTNCSSLFKKTSKTVTLCNQCNSKRVKGESQEVRMYRRAKSRAKERNITFDLEKSDVIIPDTCPILGIEIMCHKGRSGGNPNSPALDRIDNSKGYVKGNVQVVSHLANMMKSSANKEQLLRFADWIYNTYSVND